MAIILLSIFGALALLATFAELALRKKATGPKRKLIQSILSPVWALALAGGLITLFGSLEMDILNRRIYWLLLILILLIWYGYILVWSLTKYRKVKNKFLAEESKQHYLNWKKRLPRRKN